MTDEFIGPRAAFDELVDVLGESATLLKQITLDAANERTGRFEAAYKRRGEFSVGDRVVYRGAALYAEGKLTGPDVARIWTVIDCGCDLCQQASDRLLAVDQEVDGYGWRHILRSKLRHYGQPTVDEVPLDGSDARIAAMQKGLDRGWKNYRRAGR